MIPKYRAWDIKLKKMFSPEEMSEDQLTLLPDGSGFINVHGRDTRLSHKLGKMMIPLQSTGLKDKNRVEIFEGDIVRFTPQKGSSFISNMEDNKPLLKCVGKDKDNARWHWYQLNGEIQGSGYTFCKDNCETIVEIIGNKYENLELLT